LNVITFQTQKWSNHKDGRYKWLVDLEEDMYYSEGTVYEAEYLLFVEDMD